MMTIIAKIILCMLAAALLGFIIGWIFSSFVRNEKHQAQVLAVKERFDEQKAQINQLDTELDAKDREISTLKEQYTLMQKEALSNQPDDDDDSYFFKDKISDLEAENLLLLEQIKEQKICEDEKELLDTKLKTLEEEKEELLSKVEELNEFKISYKENIRKIAELESHQNKIVSNIPVTITKEKKQKAKKIKKSREKKPKLEKSNKINDAICNDKYIISNKNLQIGNKEDKISKIIKNLFTEPKPDKE